MPYSVTNYKHIKENRGFMRIGIIGLGFVGMPLFDEFVRAGIDVYGFDTDVRKSDRPFDDISICDVIVVCVPTNLDGIKPDYSNIDTAAKTIGKHVKPGTLVILESTVGIGTTQSRFKNNIGVDVKIGYSSERINPGDKIHTLKNTVKLISAQDTETLALVKSVYSKIIDNLYECPSIEVAEASKLCENMQRSTNIAFMNQLAMDLPKMGLDFWEVHKAMMTKWNSMDFRPGLVSGACLPCNPFYYLENLLESDGLVTRATISTNASITDHVLNKIVELAPNSSDIQVLGLAYKPGLNDQRHSLIWDLITKLAEYRGRAHYNMHLHDVYDDLNCTIKFNADIVVIGCGHQEYTEEFVISLNPKLVIDIVGKLDGKKLPSSIKYWKLGNV